MHTRPNTKDFLTYLGAISRMDELAAAFHGARADYMRMQGLSNSKTLFLVKMGEIAETYTKLLAFARSVQPTLGDEAIKQHPLPEVHIQLSPQEWQDLGSFQGGEHPAREGGFTWRRLWGLAEPIAVPGNICPDKIHRPNATELLLYLGSLQRMECIASKFFEFRRHLSSINQYEHPDAYGYLLKMREFEEAYNEIYQFAMVQIECVFSGVVNPYPLSPVDLTMDAVEADALERFNNDTEAMRQREVDEYLGNRTLKDIWGDG